MVRQVEKKGLRLAKAVESQLKEFESEMWELDQASVCLSPEWCVSIVDYAVLAPRSARQKGFVSLSGKPRSGKGALLMQLIGCCVYNYEKPLNGR